MNLENLKSAFATQGCQKLYVKKLAANDSSKNQVYLGGSFDILNIFPVSEVYADSSGDWERDRFKADVNFYWLTEGGNLSPAPKAQFIIYPKYPEVRFSGFLAGSENPPSELMTQRLPGRLLFLSPNKEGRIIGYVSSPDSQLAQEFDHLAETQSYGVFSVIELASIANNRQNLIAELTRIHYLGWIHSKRLNSAGEILPCLAPQCVGYTLEAELGVRPNSYSEPDFLGWEIKAFGVKKFEKFAGSVITLFTPEPNGGFYGIHGLSAFVRKYGYCDLRGREDRINFGGIYKVENTHPRTKLRLEIVGFDHVSGKNIGFQWKNNFD
ncbi:MAG: hypothetical protein KIS77_13770 [Saprospiraceae bacterium]|nr:hypothetical protein [Saprospiraceae bacterium]